MTLKRKLRQLIAAAKKEKQTKKKETKIQPRNDADWEIIKPLLSQHLIDLAQQSEGESHLEIFPADLSKLSKNSTREQIKLTDDSKLCITPNDIIRFCKENHLKLRFYYTYDGSDLWLKRRYKDDEFNFFSFLIIL